ncbi:HNH endonuclease [Mesorhizobium sp. M0854]|uniref:HNH endonuclease n=1 Tax=Mesorhizobium sp. M0854 TaxID=2957013 RepID=UPI0033385F14
MARLQKQIDRTVPKLTFRYRSGDAQAFGRLLPDGGFVVLADSSAVRESSASDKRDRAERDSLVRRGVLVGTEKPNLLGFAHDHTFTSPSRAAGVIRDGNVSGPQNWIEPRSGMSLKDFLEGDPAFAPLRVHIPDYLKADGSAASAPFSKSSHGLFKRETLGSDGAGDGARTDYFKEHLVRIFKEIGEVPVPYRFIDGNGSRRSMDGGCLKFVGPDGQNVADFVCNRDGFIVAVQPKQSLVDALSPSESSTASDLAALDADTSISATQREQLVLARLGQGKFRARVLALWDGRCAVTGCSLGAVIRASHLLPWRAATNEERLDPENGLPLVATLDALFDAGLISFDEDGVLLATQEMASHSGLLEENMSLSRKPTARMQVFLSRHRAANGFPQ